eukprot:GFKZ01004784.1.p1 GENE.GFKZ01004784.1~~GFKZ01004784.1.p1  ORF type:complete len:534 (+),score=45.14 GFKZ01004784.1:112-1713(+)
MSFAPVLTLLIALLLSPALCQLPTNAPNSELSFRNMFSGSGLDEISPARSNKFGGPTVADLDSDGNYDIILNFHNRNLSRIYMGDGTGRFQIFRNPNNGRFFRPNVFDVHGIQVAQLTATSMTRLISFNVGGGRGGNPRPPEMYTMSATREFEDVTTLRGLGQLTARPRITMFMDLALNRNGRRRARGGGPDALFISFLIPPHPGNIQFAYENNRGQYRPVTDLGAFSNIRRGRAELTDRNGDGRMELISIQDFKFFDLVAPFTFRDITNTVLPANLDVAFLSTSAVAEFDFDNDGDFDLYIARADRSLTTRRPMVEASMGDILLRNDNGRYVDATAGSGIPDDTNSFAVTVGDFNNDGFIDVLVVLYDEPDMFLLNNGDGTFRRVDNVIPKRRGDIGNNAVAVDYDKDGKLDVIVGQGTVSGSGLGPYLLMKNMMNLNRNTNYLVVTVFNDPTRASTSLHAVVTIFMPRRRRLVRRVGSQGAAGAGGSYLDTLHFGVGRLRSLNRVSVRWTTGIVRSMRNVRVNRQISFGVQ